jgi:hypothetical protein
VFFNQVIFYLQYFTQNVIELLNGKACQAIYRSKCFQE